VTKLGIRLPTYIAVAAMILGAWLRVLVNTSFNFVIIGQWIMAIGQPLTLVAPPKVAATWFGDNQRALATTIGALAGPVGCVIGFVFPFAFLGDGDIENTSDARTKVRNYILVQSIIVTLLGLPIFFFVKNKPKIAPSVSALKALTMKPENMCVIIKKLIKNRDYLLLMI
jgi:MFS family permease